MHVLVISTLFFTDTRIKDLQNLLIETNEDATHCVPLHPLYANTGLSVDELYAEVVVREDLASIQKKGTTEPTNRHQLVTSPSDLFSKDGMPVTSVYMLGQPGYGKTTFCLNLLKLWCLAKKSAGIHFTLWQLDMYTFDFVFYVSLRHVDRCRTSVVDMICEDVFERDDKNKDVIRHVLGSSDFRCLVIVDGLDEWVLSTEVQTKLRQKGLPNAIGLSKNCTVLYASRHWKVELIQPKYSRNDKVVEILGLTEKGTNTIIQNILVNFFKLEIESPEYEAKVIDLKNQIQNAKSRSSMKIPLLVSMSVFLGFDGNYVQESVTGLFLDQLELLIKRAIDNGHIDSDVTEELNTTMSSKIKIPTIIQDNKAILQLIVVFYKFGKIAFNDLISKESHLVFKRETLQEIVSERELDIALKVGVVSQMRAPGRFNVPKISIEFLHKSIQEAMAALYIACDKSDAFSSLCEYCCTVEKVLEMSNVLLYMTGISPSTGCKFSSHIVDCASIAHELQNERQEFPNVFGEEPNSLFTMQCKCYAEMARTLSLTKDLDPAIKYCVTDVVVDHRDDTENLRITGDLMKGCPESILSIDMLFWGGNKWLETPVLQILPQFTHLTTFRLRYWRTSPDPELVNVIPKMTHVERVKYQHESRAGDIALDSHVVNAIFQLPLLKNVILANLELDHDTLALTYEMTQLLSVTLTRINMLSKCWESFLSSLHSPKQAVDVTLDQCNIDAETVDMLSSSGYFTVITKEKGTDHVDNPWILQLKSIPKL